MIKNIEQREQHTIEPFYRKDSEILILGSFPSVKSREVQFYYGHPQNRFWKVLAAVWKEEIPQSTEEKKEFLQRNHIALWDVIASCDITGSSDASIANIEYNDIYEIINGSPIRKILVNGRKAYELFQKKYPKMELPVYKMHSTSPANASWSLLRLTEEWRTVIYG